MDVAMHAGGQHYREGSLASKIGFVVAVVVAASVGLAIVLQLQDATYKMWVIVIVMALVPAALVISKRPKEVLLFGWVFSLTYNRQYYVFERVVGYNGTQGPYVMLPDVCLIGLFAYWMYERLVGKPDDTPRGAPLWPWFAPFAAICFLSIFPSERPDWGFYEMLRIAKMGLVLFYIRRNFGRREWMVSLAALALAVSFQSAVGIKELITGKAGVIGAEQVGGDVSFLKHFAQGAFTSGIVRGQGTLSHPPYLACYLLMVIPVLLALALTASSRRRALLYGLAFLLGCGGLASTLSRAPWLLAAVQIVLVVIIMVVKGRFPLQRALGLGIVGSCILGVALIPVRGKLMARLTGDFTESVNYREEGIEASWTVIQKYPLLGLGLNNTELYFVKYMPDMDWALSTEDFATRTLHLRAPIVLGNGLLHVAEETGLLGLAAFIFLIIGTFVVGIRSASVTTDECWPACVGIMLGIMGALGEQFVDAPFWIDSVLFTFALYVGMLSVAAPLFRRTPARDVSRQLL